MDSSEREGHSSHGSLACSSGPPVTPDSVMGADIRLDGGESSSFGASSSQSSSDMSVGSNDEADLAAAHLRHILKVEGAEQYQVAPHYLHSSVLLPAAQESKDQGVSERCRRRTCEWMYDICDYFHLNREAVGIALFYVDRYFTLTFDGPAGQEVPVTRKRFQLVALTALYVAVKLHGESRQANRNMAGKPAVGSPGQSQPQWNRSRFSLAVCASISRNQFTPGEIEECERDVFRTLDWHVNPIVPSGPIVESLLLHLPSTEERLPLFVYDCAKYLSELSVSVPALSLVYRPSVVAYASISHALDVLRSKSGPDAPKLSEQSRQEFEAQVLRASSHHFHREKRNVDGAKKILQTICPNLTELFPLPSTTPRSPTSVKSQ
ncbi:hypothetical protein ACHAXT_005676 [Thalassiosira profunda]